MGPITLTLQGVPCFSITSSTSLPLLSVCEVAELSRCLSKMHTSLCESCEPASDDGNLRGSSRLSVLGNLLPRVMEKVAEATSESPVWILGS